MAEAHARLRIRLEPSDETGGASAVRSSAAWHRARAATGVEHGRGPSR